MRTVVDGRNTSILFGIHLTILLVAINVIGNYPNLRAEVLCSEVRVAH